MKCRVPLVRGLLDTHLRPADGALGPPVHGERLRICQAFQTGSLVPARQQDGLRVPCVLQLGAALEADRTGPAALVQWGRRWRRTAPRVQLLAQGLQLLCHRAHRWAGRGLLAPAPSHEAREGGQAGGRRAPRLPRHVWAPPLPQQAHDLRGQRHRDTLAGEERSVGEQFRLWFGIIEVTSASWRAPQGSASVTSSSIVIPSAKTSLAADAATPVRSSSGASHRGLIRCIVAVAARVSAAPASMILARPRSQSLAWQWSSSRMFGDLTSLCRTGGLLPCRNSRARAASAAIRRRSPQSSSCGAAESAACSDPLLQYCVMMVGGSRQTPMKSTMLGWAREASSSASCS